MNNNDAAALARAPPTLISAAGRGAPAPAISTTAEAIKPFRQLRQHHEINDSFRLDLRQGGGRLSAASDLPTSTVLPKVPSALRRTYRLSPACGSISSRLLLVLVGMFVPFQSVH